MLAAGSLLLAGCGGRQGPSPAARAAFLTEVHSAVPQVGTYRSDVALVRLGEAACAELSAGASFSSVVEQLRSSRLPTSDLGALIAAAATDLCPAYRGRAGIS